MTMAQRKKTKKIVLTIVMLILALIYIYPVFLMVINSVKPFGEVIMDVTHFQVRLNGAITPM